MVVDIRGVVIVVIVVVDPRNQPLKFGQNQLSDSYILVTLSLCAEMVDGGGGWVEVYKVIFLSNPTLGGET